MTTWVEAECERELDAVQIGAVKNSKTIIAFVCQSSHCVSLVHRRRGVIPTNRGPWGSHADQAAKEIDADTNTVQVTAWARNEIALPNLCTLDFAAECREYSKASTPTSKI